MFSFYMFFQENICSGYSLEAPRGGTSHKYDNVCFPRDLRKLSILLDEKLALSRAMNLSFAESAKVKVT